MADRRILHWLFPTALFSFATFFNALMAQQVLPAVDSAILMKGIIYGEARTRLPAVSIVVRETGQSTITDKNGEFAIAAKINMTLDISHIGYHSASHTITIDPSVTIQLKPVTIELEDVVLVGYSKIKVKEITGSIAIVKPRELMAVPVSQVEQMLQGRVAGLNVVSSGAPGGAVTISLHGTGNFGDVRPLYIIDGIQGDINILNPGDIASIQVLKDAGAYAVYGVRGANGVIVVETKKGKAGSPKVSYEMYAGYQLPVNNDEILSPQETADLTWLALKNSGEVGPNGNPDHPLYGNGVNPVLPYYYSAGPYQGLAENDPRADPSLYNIDFSNGALYQIVKANQQGTDWTGEIFNPAFSQYHSLNISGGSDNNRYLAGASYLNQQGTLRYAYLKRYTARINSSFKLGKNIRAGENLQLAFRENPDETEILSTIFGAATAETIVPVFDINGGWASARPDNLSANPAAGNYFNKDDKTSYADLIGNAWLEVDFFSRFSFRSSFGGNLGYFYGYNFNFGGYSANAAGQPNNVFTEYSGYARSYTWTNSISYARNFREHHVFKAFAAAEAINSNSRRTGGSRTGLFSNDPSYRFLTNGTPSTPPNYSFATVTTLLSVIGKLDYAYKEKYLLSLTLRRDASSLFGKQNRFGWFPAVSGAWRVTEEKFLHESNVLTDVKLRASWGKTGFYGNTDPLNQYTLYGGTVSDAYYDILGVGSGNIQQGFRNTRIGNPSTGWQEDEQVNAGIEAVMWKGSLYFTADWYKKTANGLLFPVTLPDILGGATPPNTNVGKIQNRGFDLLIGSRGKSADFTWDVSFTFTKYKNMIKQLNDLAFFDVPASGGFVRNEIGRPANSFFGYQVIGFFKDDGDVAKSPVQPDAKTGRFKYRDADNDGFITDKDRVHFGNANPDFTLGINLNLTWREFEFSVFCYSSSGNQVIAPRNQLTDFFPTFQGLGRPVSKSKTLLYNSWTPTHPDPKTSIAENSINFSNVGVFNSYIMQDGSYFRGKLFTLGYRFNKKILDRLRMDNLRIYVQAVNLFTISSYTGLDPEIGGAQAERYGVDFTHYPNNQRQFVIGINLDL